MWILFFGGHTIEEMENLSGIECKRGIIGMWGMGHVFFQGGGGMGEYCLLLHYLLWNYKTIAIYSLLTVSTDIKDKILQVKIFWKLLQIVLHIYIYKAACLSVSEWVCHVLFVPPSPRSWTTFQEGRDLKIDT